MRLTRRQGLRAGLAGATAVLLAGCGTLHEGRVDPALFHWPPAADAPPRLPGRVALVVPPAVAESTRTATDLGRGSPSVRLPVGRIVQAALLEALGAVFAGGVAALEAPPAPGSGYTAAALLHGVDADAQDRLTLFIPVPLGPLGLDLFTRYEASVRLSFDLETFDAQGRSLGSRHHVAGPLRWERSAFTREAVVHGVVRLVHEAAAQAALAAAQALRVQLEAEHIRARPL
jgi:hypothetical protein